jgi:hypothetical protein
MDINIEILAQLKLFNENLAKLTEAFNKHCNQTHYGPTSPLPANVKPVAQFKEKKYSELTDQFSEALNKVYRDKYLVDDNAFFSALGFPMMGDQLDQTRMQKLAGIKPRKPMDIDGVILEYKYTPPKNLDHVPLDAQFGYQAKGYGCKDAKQCMKPHPHYEQDCEFRLPYGSFSYGAAMEIYQSKGMEGLKKYAPAGLDVEGYVKKYGTHWIAPSMPYVDPGEFDDEEKTDPMIKPATTDLKLQRKKDGLCPECGKAGEWKAMACVCPEHGRYMG